jgi:hypothetical protein
LLLPHPSPDTTPFAAFESKSERRLVPLSEYSVHTLPCLISPLNPEKLSKHSKVHMDLGLADKTVLVLGASSGLALAIANCMT